MFSSLQYFALFWIGLSAAVGLLAGCNQAPPPDETQALAVVRQYVEEHDGVLEIHESLGRIRRARPLELFAVRTKKCRLIAKNAYWCEFLVEYATVEQARMSSPIALRVEIRNGEYRSVRY